MRKKNILFSRYFRVSLLLLVFSFLIFSCSKKEKQVVVQFSTIDALLQGVYDGVVSLAELSKYGDFGIGTFNALDGEMIFLDGHIYQAKADGKIYQPSESELTPFASVTFFNPEVKYEIKAQSYAGVKSIIDSLMHSPNLFYAIKIQGKFSYVKTRSVPAQQKPYPVLKEVTANQPEFEAKQITGILSGFYCPPFVTGVNVPGFHLHFLSDDKNFGGHVLDLNLTEGRLMLDQINEFKLMLPEDGGFLRSDLTNDLSEDLKNIEGGS